LAEETPQNLSEEELGRLRALAEEHGYELLPNGSGIKNGRWGVAWEDFEEHHARIEAEKAAAKAKAEKNKPRDTPSGELDTKEGNIELGGVLDRRPLSELAGLDGFVQVRTAGSGQETAAKPKAAAPADTIAVRTEKPHDDKYKGSGRDQYGNITIEDIPDPALQQIKDAASTAAQKVGRFANSKAGRLSATALLLLGGGGVGYMATRPGANEGAVVGAPDPNLGQQPKAILKPNAPDPQDTAFTKQPPPPHTQPKQPQQVQTPPAPPPVFAQQPFTPPPPPVAPVAEITPPARPVELPPPVAIAQAPAEAEPPAEKPRIDPERAARMERAVIKFDHAATIRHGGKDLWKEEIPANYAEIVREIKDGKAAYEKGDIPGALIHLREAKNLLPKDNATPPQDIQSPLRTTILDAAREVKAQLMEEKARLSRNEDDRKNHLLLARFLRGVDAYRYSPLVKTNDEGLTTAAHKNIDRYEATRRTAVDELALAVMSDDPQQAIEAIKKIKAAEAGIKSSVSGQGKKYVRYFLGETREGEDEVRKEFNAALVKYAAEKKQRTELNK
jgi:hypothetical protein